MNRRLVSGVLLGVAGVCLSATSSVRAQSCPNDGAGTVFNHDHTLQFNVDLGQITGAGATLFLNFFSAPASTNDWIDVDNDGQAGFFNTFPFVDQLAAQFTPTQPPALNTEWIFQYRPVGSVNGFNEFVENQTCGALRTNIPADISAFNGFTYASAGARAWAGPFDIPSGTPLAPCSIDFAALDVPGAWAVQVPGTPEWDRKPTTAGYGLNPIVSSTGYVSNLQTASRQCGICSVGGRPCTSDVNCNGTCNGDGLTWCVTNADCANASPPNNCVGASTCTLSGPVVSLNQNASGSQNANTINDNPMVFVPIVPIANRGSGVQNVSYTDLRYVFVTGRMPNGENLVAATRSVGSGTRNGEMNSLGIDTSWGRGDNVGNEVTVTGRFDLGPGTQQSNGEGSGQTEESVRQHRLAIGYTGLGGSSRAIGDTIAGQYEILNVCKDVAGCDCTNLANFVRPSINTVLDNCNACTGFTLGGPETFITRGDPDANRDPMDQHYNAVDPPTANQQVANYINNIIDSLASFDGSTQPAQCFAAEVCHSKKCSNSATLCSVNADCPGGTCGFVNCVADGDCTLPTQPIDLGACDVPRNCTSDATCTTRTCSVDGMVCTGTGNGTCSQVPDPQTCRADFCKSSANMPGQFMATAFFLIPSLDCAQSVTDPAAFNPNLLFVQSIQDYVRAHNGLGVSSDTPAFGSVNTAGQVPVRIALSGGNFYSDGSTTGSYEYWNGASYVTISSGQKLSKRNRLAGDFNNNGVRDVSDISEMVKAVYGPRAWQQTAAASGTGTGFDLGNMTTDNAIPEVIGDFNGDGSLDKEDLRYMMDGLSISGGSLNRKQGAIAVDNALQAGTHAFPWAEPAQSTTISAGAFPDATEPTFSTPHDVNGVPKFLKTGKVYANGDFRGDVAGNGYQACVNGHCNYTNETCVTAATCPRTPPTPGAQPMGWDGVVDDKDISYCCKMVRAGTWHNLSNAVLSDLSCDMNGDADVTFADVQELVQGILGTQFGDVNLDGVADAADRAIIQASIDGPNPCIAAHACGWADGDMNCDGVVDASDLANVTPAPENVANPVDKPRYLSFRESSAVAAPVPKAIQVTLVLLMHPSPGNLPGHPAPDFTGFEGQVRYANNPHLCQESETPFTPFSCSELKCTPEYRDDWASWGDIHLYGSAIVPSSKYDIQAIYLDATEPSAALTITTGRWGDVVTPFQGVCTCNVGGAECVVNSDCGANGPCNCPALTQPNIQDISAIVDKFKSVPNAPIIARADLVPNIPDNVVNISDVAACVDSFKNIQYVQPGPSACP